MQSSFPRILTVSASLLATGAIAFFAGRWSAAGGGASATQAASVPASDSHGGAGSRMITGQEAAVADEAKAAVPADIQRLLGSDSSFDRMKGAILLAETLTPQTMAAALEQFQRLPDQADKAMGVQMLLTRWAEIDPQGALRYCESKQGGDGMISSANVYAAWARKDFNAALASARGVADVQKRKQALQGVMMAMAVKDPQGALQLAKTLPPGDVNEWTSSMIFSMWVSKDPQAASQAVLQLPPGQDRENTLRNMAYACRPPRCATATASSSRLSASGPRTTPWAPRPSSTARPTSGSRTRWPQW
jgi:hypothetical protein